MAETEKVPVEVGQKEMEQPAASREWRLLQNVRKEIDRLFEDFNLRSWRLPFARGPGEIEPLWRSDTSWGSAPFVDVVDKENYEVTAELPRMDPSNISVKFSTGTLTIKGEKKEEKEEKGKDSSFLSGVGARFSDPSECLAVSMKRRSKRPSATASSRSYCRSPPRRKKPKRSSTLSGCECEHRPSDGPTGLRFDLAARVRAPS